MQKKALALDCAAFSAGEISEEKGPLGDWFDRQFLLYKINDSYLKLLMSETLKIPQLKFWSGSMEDQGALHFCHMVL